MSMQKNTKMILTQITEYYLSKPNFNGISFKNLCLNNILIDEQNLFEIIISLIKLGKIDLRFGDFHPNQHIQGMLEYPKNELLKIASFEKVLSSCIYPTKKHLRRIVDKKQYEGRPFTLKLALGYYHLDFEPFDLSVLEVYRNDPRYKFINSDVSGHIYYVGKPRRRNNPDNVYLQDYGFCFNNKRERAIAVFLTRLATLTPEHQQLWNAKKLKGKYILHPDFDRKSKGHFPKGISIFEAFTYEMIKINEICQIIGHSPLFKKTFTIHSKPKEFTFLIRPTLKEFENFVHVTDKLISENIDSNFFVGLNLEKEEIRKDKKIVVRRKGTIELLEEWFYLHYKHPDESLIKRTLKPLRELRRMRQLPAHSISDNIYDQKYYKLQKNLIVKLFESITGIRYILMSHPLIKETHFEKFKNKYEIWLE